MYKSKFVNNLVTQKIQLLLAVFAFSNIENYFYTEDKITFLICWVVRFPASREILHSNHYQPNSHRDKKGLWKPDWKAFLSVP